ncbi:ATP-binding protein [Myxococcota bacterium]|nr:ATP-binding protein [Myxococcota bacterium]MBU1898857.1 ATP-binding protein [Myxococcota bacterium]
MTRHVPEIVLLRGASGVGKSTLSDLLKASGVVAAVVEVDSIRHMLAGISWSSPTQHWSTLEGALALTGAFVKRGLWPVLVVDALDNPALPKVRGCLSEHQVAFVALWCDADELTSRLTGRAKAYSEGDISQYVNANIGAREFAFEVVLDTTAQAPSETAEMARRLICGEGVQ